MRRLILGLIALALLGWGVAVAFTLREAAADMREGRRAAERAVETDSPVGVLRADMLDDLTRSAEKFDAAADRLGGWMLKPLRPLPVVGRQIRSAHTLARAAGDVAAAGMRAVERTDEIVGDGALPPHERIDALAALADVVDTTLATVERVDLGPDRGLFGPLADARLELVERIEDAERLLLDGRTGLRAAEAMLRGPSRYVVLAANNAEMRAGSGMFLFVGDVVLDGGRVTVGQVQSVTKVDVPPGAVELGGDLADRWGWLSPAQEWRNLMASPRFPAWAELAAEMWQAAVGTEVAGVLAIDPVGLQAILEATGPVAVEADGEETRITAADVVDELLHEQYVRFQSRPERQERLGEVARAVIAAVDAGGWDLVDMADGLASAVRGRHLMLWSADEVQQRGWEVAGTDGDLGADSLAVSLLNRGANKLDPFMRMAVDLEIEPAEGQPTQVVARISIRNQVPEGEPPYVVGPRGLGLEYGEYRGILAVNVPGGAVGVALDGVDSLAVVGPDGPTIVIGAEVLIARREEIALTLRFRLPPEMREMRVEPSARVPPTRWRAGDRRWTDAESRTVNW